VQNAIENVQFFGEGMKELLGMRWKFRLIDQLVVDDHYLLKANHC
jgi:hypothetical protein